MEMDSRYHVGDKVILRSVYDCVFGYTEQMEDIVGTSRTIERVLWNDSYGCYEYYINDRDADGRWSYDDTCFEPEAPTELPEFDVSSVDILTLFS